jgi:hypothetical protein
MSEWQLVGRIPAVIIKKYYFLSCGCLAFAFGGLSFE